MTAGINGEAHQPNDAAIWKRYWSFGGHITYDAFDLLQGGGLQHSSSIQEAV